MEKALPAWTQNSLTRLNGNLALRASVNVVSGAVRLIASLSTAIVLARLLSPEDFGLVNLVLPFVAFFLVFADVGTTSFILQKAKIDHLELSRVFWFSLLFIVIVGLIFIVFGITLGFFYGHPEIFNLSLFLSIAIFLTSFTICHNAFVKRYHRQDFFGISEIIAATCASIIPIALAYSGFGYWAIASIPVVRVFAHSVAINLISKWRPSLPELEFSKYKFIIDFGSSVIVYRVINVLSRNFDKIIVGIFFTTQDLGFYSMAVSIMFLPAIQLLAPVAGAIIPFLSDKIRDQSEFENSFFNILSILTIIITTFMLFASVYANELISIVLGNEWLPAAYFLSILSLVSITYALDSVFEWGVLGSGKPQMLVKWSYASFSILLLSVLIGASLGLEFVPISMFVGSFIYHVLFSFSVLGYLNLSKRRYLKVISQLYLFIFLYVVTTFLFYSFLSSYTDSDIVKLLMGFIFCTVTSLFLLAMIFRSHFIKAVTIFKSRLL